MATCEIRQDVAYRGEVLGLDERADSSSYCYGCGVWGVHRNDADYDDLCEECWEDLYPGIPWGEAT